MNEENKLKVVHIGEKSNDNSHYSIEQVLEELLKDIRSGEDKYKFNGMFIALVDRNPGFYDTGYRISNLSASESIALLEVMKVRMLGNMNFVKSADNT